MEKITHTQIFTNGINLHVASIGEGPPILFLHGFPQLWYCWRHQLLSLSSLGFRCIAPDLRGYGDSDAPSSVDQYTAFHVVGDLVGLIDYLGIDKVLLVGHDWGAIIAWHFCVLRPDRIKALVNTSVVFEPRNPRRRPLNWFRELFGDEFYICRFQEPGEIEKEFAETDTAKLLKRFLLSRSPRPPRIPKNIRYKDLPDLKKASDFLYEEDIDYYTSKYNQKGFTGALNYYRCMDLNWELMAPWTNAQVKVPVKFIVGELDLTYNYPGIKKFVHGDGLRKYVPFLQEVVVMEGVAHFLQEEKPEEVSAHIYDFFKKFLSEPLSRL